MKQLEKSFSGRGEVKGYEFNQIRATDKAFLYEVSCDGRKHYEVFKKRINALYGNVSYPSSKGFGKWAWTYNSLNKALLKFKDLNS